MTLSIKDRIIRSIANRKGEVVLRTDFQQMGSASQISRALKDIVESGRLVRLGYGVYAKAKINTLTNKPTPREVLEVLAQEALLRLKVNVSLGAAQRAYVDGKSTQIPMRATFNTGRRRISRKLTVGSREVSYENNYRA